MPRMKNKPKGATDVEPPTNHDAEDQPDPPTDAAGAAPGDDPGDEAPDGVVVEDAAGRAAPTEQPGPDDDGGKSRRKRRRRSTPGDETAADAVASREGDASADESDAAAAVDSRALEALLLATHHPLTAGRIADVLGLPTPRGVRTAIAALNRRYEETDRSFRIEQVAGGFQILTLPEFGDLVSRLHGREEDTRLSKAAQETLAIIAYKQPVLRSDVEAIRGVSCGETIRSLMEKRLVKIAGRAELPGRPILYGTTRRFLETFGLNTLKDLPKSPD